MFVTYECTYVYIYIRIYIYIYIYWGGERKVTKWPRFVTPRSSMEFVCFTTFANYNYKTKQI